MPSTTAQLDITERLLDLSSGDIQDISEARSVIQEAAKEAGSRDAAEDLGWLAYSGLGPVSYDLNPYSDRALARAFYLGASLNEEPEVEAEEHEINSYSEADLITAIRERFPEFHSRANPDATAYLESDHLASTIIYGSVMIAAFGTVSALMTFVRF